MKKITKKKIIASVVALAGALNSILGPFAPNMSQVTAPRIFRAEALSPINEIVESLVEIEDSKPVVTEVIAVTTCAQTTTTVKTTTTTAKTTTKKEKITTEEKRYLVFYEDSKRVHYSDCRWADDSMEKVEDEYVDYGRKCTECDPIVKIGEIYEEEEDTIEYNEEETEDYNETESGEAYTANYEVSSEDIIFLRRVVSSEYGSNWVPVEEKAKIVASIMNRVYEAGGSKTILDVLYEACVPWGFDPYGDYYMDDSIYAAVDYYFNNKDTVFANWDKTSWNGDGTWNYFY